MDENRELPQQAEDTGESPGESGEPEKKKVDLAMELFDWAQSLVFAFVGIVLLFAFVASVFSVSQTSMTNTLQDSEMVMISRLPYTPRHSDIILFTKYGWQSSYNENTGQYSPLVKRVIGVPGDEIEFVMDGAVGTVFRNGEPLDEPYIREPMTYWAHGQSIPQYFVVPEGCVFVMGDNRNGSHDSRLTDIGFVDERSILGRVILRVTPLNKFGPVT
ncbi:MAG: signal peptidase I [Oscillospiraceae bacterium]|jgi:signal peptidase I|nr:signal peptidase I [Oscillospiraceae bacterium]